MRLLPAAVMAVTFPMLVQTTDTRLVQRIGGALAIAGVGARGGLRARLVGHRAARSTARRTSTPRRRSRSSSLALPLFFLNYALTHQVIGWDGQRAYLAIATLALVANVAANFALVPVAGNDRRRHRDGADRSRRDRGLPVRWLRRTFSATVRRTVVPNLRVERRHDPDARTGARRPALGDLCVAVRLSADAGAARSEPRSASAPMPTTIESWWRDSDCCRPPIEHRDGLYFPAGRCDLVAHAIAPRSAQPRAARSRSPHPVARRRHAVRAHGRALGQPRAPQRRRHRPISICS